MKIFGWIYLIIFCLAAVLGLIDRFAPALEGLSSIIGILVFLLSIVVFILACIGKLKPRKIFLIPSVYQFLILGFGMIVGVLLLVKLGVEGLSEGVTPELMSEQFPWVDPVQWIMIIIYLCVGAYCLLAYSKAQETIEQPTSSD